MKCVIFSIMFVFMLSLFQSCISTKPEYSRNEQNYSEPPIYVAFCELLNNAETFDGKEIQTTAILLSGKESGFLYDPQCVSEEKLVWFDIKNDLENEKLSLYLRPDLPEYKFKGVLRVRIETSGIFQTKKDKGFGHLNGFNYLFTIKQIENLAPVSSEVPYPW